MKIAWMLADGPNKLAAHQMQSKASYRLITATAQESAAGHELPGFHW
jgi:hypothetical protein